MTTLRRVRVALALLALCACTPVAAAAKCELGQVAALPVRVTPQRILLDAQIDGHPVEVILDTGAQTSLLFADAVRRLGLNLSDAGGNAQMFGAGGGFTARRVRVRDLALGDSHLKNLTFWAGGRMDAEPKVAMLLGQDVLASWDVEYDLQHGAVRLFHPMGCRGDEVVYWADAYAKARMQHAMYSGATIDIDVALNHATVAATLDTGAPQTVITPQAALRAGAARQAVHVSGAQMGGLGAEKADVLEARLDSVSLGGEVIQHPRLWISDMFARNVQESTESLTGERIAMPDMLLGLDFVRAHRLMVAPDQNMVYFTYAGGPIFAPEPGAAK